MLQEEILGRKQVIVPEVSLKMIQSITGSKAFHFKDEVRRSKGDFFRLSPQNLDFKHCLDAKISLEENEIK